MRSGERGVETGREGREGVSKEEGGGGGGRGREGIRVRELEGGGSLTVCVFSLLGRAGADLLSVMPTAR